jgi:4-amino-4-deoxy-L-arabinose transferase-like glycosyltransferase
MLRVLAVLAALTVVGGVLRFHAASDPSAYQSKDEQSYAMIARGLSVTGNYGNPGMTDPVHWPPGAPLMFALAYELKPQKRGGGVWDVPSAYPAQALVGTITIPAAFLLAYLVAGWGAGLLAAAAVAFYPPLISASGDLLSEPLGALLLTSALAATVWALRRPASWLPAIAAGLLLGATILTRADLALVPAIALLVVAVAAWRRASSRPLAAATRAAGPMLVALLVILTPWTVFASS